MVKSSIMDFSDVSLFQEFSIASRSLFVKVPLFKGFVRGVKYKTSSSGCKYETEYYADIKYNAYDLKRKCYAFISDSTEVKVTFV